MFRRFLFVFSASRLPCHSPRTEQLSLSCADPFSIPSTIRSPVRTFTSRPRHGRTARSHGERDRPLRDRRIAARRLHAHC